ncbi:hypothetical protein JR334_01885 [Clostridia bacterium]|nr:hypothetical protein JR334_01885 [Clostridia bacterium]
MNTCKNCNNRIDNGPHNLGKCRMTGLAINNLEESCLAWTKKESPSGARTPDEEQTLINKDIIS